MTDEGYASMGGEENQFVMVCGHCAYHDNKRCVLEINFVDMVMYYRCGKCKKINTLDFSLMRPKPYPSIGVRRG